MVKKVAALILFKSIRYLVIYQQIEPVSFLPECFQKAPQDDLSCVTVVYNQYTPGVSGDTPGIVMCLF